MFCNYYTFAIHFLSVLYLHFLSVSYLSFLSMLYIFVSVFQCYTFLFPSFYVLQLLYFVFPCYSFFLSTYVSFFLGMLHLLYPFFVSSSVKLRYYLPLCALGFSFQHTKPLLLSPLSLCHTLTTHTPTSCRRIDLLKLCCFKAGTNTINLILP